jgi:hypothetical protein
LLVTERLSVEEANQLRADYNFILNMAATDETGSLTAFWRELRKFIRASKGNRAKIDAYVNRELPKQPFFAGLTGAQIGARIEEAQPELAPDVSRAVERQQLIIQQLAEQYGVTLPEEQTREIAEDARRNNLSQFEIAVRLRPLVEQAISGDQDLMGQAGNAETQLLNWTRQNGLQMSRADIAPYLSNITLGRQTLEDAQQDIRRTYLAGMFPAWADKINEGFDPSQIFSPYRNAARNLLELDDIGFDDPIIKRATQRVGADGKPVQMPLYEFEQEVRKDPRWQTTDNAYKTYTDVGTDLLRMFGFR